MASLRTLLRFVPILIVFISTALRADLVITEIHYAPKDLDDPSVDRPDLQFVEIFNDGPEAYDLSNYFFTRGISYQFPEGTIVRGRSYIVVAQDEGAVRDAYGISNVLGDFDGNLDNSGETVELANPQGRGVSTVPYNDRGQWPSGASGTGHSLSIEYAYSDPGDADNWALSQQLGGTPGRVNFANQTTFDDRVIVPDDSVWKYFKGNRAPPSNWEEPDFNDGSWLSGRTGIGYGDGDDR
ncbi:MAG: lamin tail domain-containing protein, partial [Planctomycetota bacterium]